jgi:hypothetical protein
MVSEFDERAGAGVGVILAAEGEVRTRHARVRAGSLIVAGTHGRTLCAP